MFIPQIRIAWCTLYKNINRINPDDRGKMNRLSKLRDNCGPDLIGKKMVVVSGCFSAFMCLRIIALLYRNECCISCTIYHV